MCSQGKNWRQITIPECHEACHVSNLGICRHYCIDGNIINTFWALQFATSIAEVKGFAQTGTPQYVVGGGILKELDV